MYIHNASPAEQESTFLQSIKLGEGHLFFHQNGAKQKDRVRQTRNTIRVNANAVDSDWWRK